VTFIVEKRHYFLLVVDGNLVTPIVNVSNPTFILFDSEINETAQ